MLSGREDIILKAIVEQYIIKARPVPSQSITDNYELGVSAATIRNEMAYLEQENYITRAHSSAGSVPSDKGYRRYVESLGDIRLPLAEQRLVSHLFHQVEKRLDEWLHLAATLIAQMVHNTVVVTIPKPKACQLKHLELISLQDHTALIILVLNGIKVRQQLICFDRAMNQAELTAIAGKLTATYLSLDSARISAKATGLSPTEQQATDCLVNIMEAEDDREYEEQYLDGLHFMLSQPEFAHNQRMSTLMELVEQRSLLKSILQGEPTSDKVQVIIGRENKAEALHDYSVVIHRYGLPEEAIGTIGVIGPTRMPYAHTIATVNYLSLILNRLAAQLYGKEIPVKLNPNTTN